MTFWFSFNEILKKKQFNKTALLIAIEKDDLDMTELLLSDKNTDVNLKCVCKK